MTDHTKEPWKIVNLGDCHWGEDCQGHIDIEGADGNTVNPTPYNTDSVDAPRIVACVNACAGLPQSVVELTAEIGGFKATEDKLRQDKAELLEVIEDAVADLAPTPKEDCGCESGNCSRCCDCSDCTAIRADDVSVNLQAAIANAKKGS